MILISLRVTLANVCRGDFRGAILAMFDSGFAKNSKEAVGATPIDHLIRWRMLLAGDRLRNSGDSIAVMSQSLGYESESAFSTAFKRVMACWPRQSI